MTIDHFINPTYDNKLQAIEKLKWLPWVGVNFPDNSPEGKLLIVGESHYCPKSDPISTRNLIKKHEKNPIFTREIIWECPIWGEWRNRTLENIAKVLLGATKSNHQELWKGIAFYNIIQKILEYSDQPERPTPHDFALGWDIFIKIIKIIKPSQCIFLGTEASHSMSQAMQLNDVSFSAPTRREKIGRCWGYRATLKIENYELPIIFIQHPGKYFSPTAWHDYLKRELPELMAKIQAEYPV